jgi:hypothetical protein
LFAIEHGLSDADVLVLKAAVGSAVRAGHLPETAWLPFVVYATEIGYHYSGDEYWPTFEASIPELITHGDRHYIRRSFLSFHETFSGARPTGPWADHFSIICWPITHAVLPTDLQRQFARLLFESRHILTARLLHHPDELGQRLAARSFEASSRFQKLAENTALLGRVASALLIGDEEDSPHLLPATLQRIVGDLEGERIARRWLRDAKSTATRVRTRGFRRPDPGVRPPGEGGSRSEALAPSTDPELTLRWQDGTWVAYLEFPDLSVLAARFPVVRDELNRRRAVVEGAAASPIASGRLLYGRQRLRLAAWPRPEAPLVQLEGGTPEINSILADQSVFPRASRWLFRIRTGGVATEVRGGFVRPGHEYVLLSSEPSAIQPQTWISAAMIATEGVTAWTLTLPPLLEDEHIAILQELGLGSSADVEIRPVGVVPPLWDGEGTAEWFVGETPTLAILTSRDIARAVVSLDSRLHLIDWPGETPLFVRVDGLDPGTHEVGVSLIGADDAQTIATGNFEILIRPPGARPTGGTLREGLRLLPSPVNPSLDELWDGKAAVEVLGPSGVEVDLSFGLLDRAQVIQAQARVRTALPVERPKWLNLLASRFRADSGLQQKYDEAETCVVSARHTTLGQVLLRSARAFAPLRWAGGHGRNDQPFLRLVNNTEVDVIEVEFYEFDQPEVAQRRALADDLTFRAPAGGLVVARAGEHVASAILPREAHGLRDLHAEPSFPERTKSLHSALSLLASARRWADGALPGSPAGDIWRVQVLQAITAELCSLISGGRWATVERLLAEAGPDLDLSAARSAIGQDGYQAVLGQDLAREAGGWADKAPEDRAVLFAASLDRCARHQLRLTHAQRLAEFALRLASHPASVAGWEDMELQSFLQRTLDSPVLVRAARFVIIAVDVANRDTTPGRTWAWK